MVCYTASRSRAPAAAPATSPSLIPGSQPYAAKTSASSRSCVRRSQVGRYVVQVRERGPLQIRLRRRAFGWVRSRSFSARALPAAARISVRRRLMPNQPADVLEMRDVAGALLERRPPPFLRELMCVHVGASLYGGASFSAGASPGRRAPGPRARGRHVGSREGTFSSRWRDVYRTYAPGRRILVATYSREQEHERGRHHQTHGRRGEG